jgi:hypothetical protein
MPEIIHFRGSEKIMKKKKLEKDVATTLQYLEDMLRGTLYKRELTLLALNDCDWREGDLTILDGRGYQYKGFKNGVAIEGNFASYEYILEGLFRLQIGFDKGRIETGILMLTSERSEKSRLGTSIELAKLEVEQLYPTISMPVTIALFDLGSPELPDENSVKGGEADGVSVQAVSQDAEYSEEDQQEWEPFP